MKTPLQPRSIASNLRVAESLNHAIVTLCAENDAYWHQSDADLLAELNTNISITMEKFEGNYNLSIALNAAQDALGVEDQNGNPVFTARAPTLRGRNDIGFADGAFFIVSPVAIYPEHEQ